MAVEDDEVVGRLSPKNIKKSTKARGSEQPDSLSSDASSVPFRKMITADSPPDSTIFYPAAHNGMRGGWGCGKKRHRTKAVKKQSRKFGESEKI